MTSIATSRFLINLAGDIYVYNRTYPQGQITTSKLSNKQL